MSFPQAAAYPQSSQATTALVMGILGIVCCGPLAIVAWVMANKELEEIASGMRNPQNEGTAKAAKVIGIIGTVLLGIGLILIVLFISGATILPFEDL
jgi:hypothetical protein